MKAKKINKKLSFNKLTVSNLSSINGGQVGAKLISLDSNCLRTCHEYSCAFDTRCPQVGCI
jgi:hypothetical protein